MSPFTKAEAKALIPDPTSSLCGVFVKTLLQLPVFFYQWISSFVGDDGEYIRTVEPGDLIYSFAPLVSNQHRLRCDGASYSTTTYAVLYAAIGNAFDTMDGQSAPGAGFFRVPKCGARFPLATGSLPLSGAVALGSVSGEERHVLLVAEMPKHKHATTLHRSSPDSGPDNLFATGNGPDDGGDYPDQTYDTSEVGSDTAHNNIPPYFGVHCYIATGI